MSLVTTSSKWTNEEQTKKRIPTIRKTIRKSIPSSSLEKDEFNSVESLYKNNIEDITLEQETTNKRNLKVADMIDKITESNANYDGDLENFIPLSYDSEPGIEEMETASILPSDYAMNRQHVTNSNFTPDNTQRTVNIQSDFNRVYDVSTKKPFYASEFGLGKERNNNTYDSKVTDRLSYIVHMLEQQQNEKTNNVLEEYVLYILLGTFVIFVVDSFSRGGKYVR